MHRGGAWNDGTGLLPLPLVVAQRTHADLAAGGFATVQTDRVQLSLDLVSVATDGESGPVRMNPDRGLLFDLDGTLLDTNSHHVIACTSALATFGVAIGADRLSQKSFRGWGPETGGVHRSGLPRGARGRCRCDK